MLSVQFGAVQFTRGVLLFFEFGILPYISCEKKEMVDVKNFNDFLCFNIRIIIQKAVSWKYGIFPLK